MNDFNRLLVPFSVPEFDGQIPASIGMNPLFASPNP
jgi:hypothetical protein